MQKKPYEVEQFLSKLQPNFPIILLYGPDRGKVAHLAHNFAYNNEITRHNKMAILNCQAEELQRDGQKLLSLAASFSIFDDKRFIWVKNAANQPGLIAALRELIANMPPNCYILLEAAALTPSSSLRKLIEGAKNAMALPCYLAKPQDIASLAKEMAGEYNMTIANDALLALSSMLGSDHMFSRMDIEKLCLYASDHKQITLKDVHDILQDYSMITTDRVTGAVLLGNKKELALIYNREHIGGPALALILQELTRQFEQLLLLHERINRENLTITQAIAKASPPIIYSKQAIYRQAFYRWSERDLLYGLERLFALKLKGRQYPALEKQAIISELFMLCEQIAP